MRHSKGGSGKENEQSSMEMILRDKTGRGKQNERGKGIKKDAKNS